LAYNDTALDKNSTQQEKDYYNGTEKKTDEGNIKKMTGMFYRLYCSLLLCQY